MTKKSRSSLIAQANTDLPDNNAMEISPADVRGMFKDVIDSFVSNSGETSISGVLRYLNTVSIADDYDLITKKYFDDNTGTLLGDYFKQGGNSFGATATIGTNDEEDFIIETFGVERVEIGSDGKIVINQGTALATHWIQKSQGNDSTTFATKYLNDDDDLLASLRDDGIFSAYGGLSTDGTISFLADTANNNIKLSRLAGNGASGTNNIFLGQVAGQNQTGSNSIFIGSGAGEGQDGASAVIGIGFNAFVDNQASDGISIGTNSGMRNTGVSCLFIGQNTGTDNEGNSVLAIGASAANNNTAPLLIAIGAEAGADNEGDNCTFIGPQSGKENTRNGVFSVSGISEVFWNNIGDKGFTTLQEVKIQTAMSEEGTDEDADNSIQSICSALGTGAGLSGDVVFKYAESLGTGTTRHLHSESVRMKGPTGVWVFQKDIEIDGIVSGIILKDRTLGTRHRLFLNNGSWDLESA